MGFVSKLIGRIPVFFIGVGLVLITGSYRGNEPGFETMPLVGGGLVVFGVVLFAGLAMTDVGS